MKCVTCYQSCCCCCVLKHNRTLCWAKVYFSSQNKQQLPTLITINQCKELNKSNKSRAIQLEKWFPWSIDRSNRRERESIISFHSKRERSIREDKKITVAVREKKMKGNLLLVASKASVLFNTNVTVERRHSNCWTWTSSIAIYNVSLCLYPSLYWWPVTNVNDLLSRHQQGERMKAIMNGIAFIMLLGKERERLWVEMNSLDHVKQ